MFRYTIKNIWVYKTRLGLSMLSIILGIAFLSGTLVYSATLQNAFNDLFSSVFKKTDAVVRSSQTQQANDGFSEDRQNVERVVLDKVKTVEGVKSASGVVEIQNLTVIGADGKRLFTLNGPPTFGFSKSTNPDLALFYLVGDDGKSLSMQETIDNKLADDQMYVDQSTAEIKHFKIGDKYKVLLPDSVKEYTISGFVRFGTSDSVGGSAAFIFNEKQAQLINGKGDTFSNINVAAKKGVSQDQLKKDIESVIVENKSTPGFGNLEVQTGKKLAKESQNQAKVFLNFFTYILLGFGVVAMVVALVIIVNSFAIIVVQRKREYALLRAIGAKSSQIRRSVLIESLAVGLVASALGIVAGVGLAICISKLFEALDIHFPAGGLVIPSSAIILGMSVGTIATVCSAFFPSWMGSRVPPIEALRESAYEKNRTYLWRYLALGVTALLAIVFIIISNNSDKSKPGLMGYGILFVFLSTVIALPALVKFFTKIVGSRPAGVLLVLFGGRRAFGITGEIARRNNYRNPRRTSRTALALLIGVFLVSGISVLASSAAATFDNYFEQNFAGDIIIGDFGATASLTPERCQSINELEEVQAGSCFIDYQADVNLVPDNTNSSQGYSKENITAANTQGIDNIFISPYEGRITNLTNGEFFVSKEYAEHNSLKLNDVISITTESGSNTYKLVGIIDKSIFDSGGIVIDQKGSETIFPPKSAYISIVTLNKGVSINQGLNSVNNLLKDTGISVTDQKSLRDNQAAQINNMLNVVYGLLGLAIIIAAIGILNTMSLSILERRRELGLLRAVGTTKSQVRGIVRFESVIVAVLGTVIGMITGIVASFLLIVSLKDEGFKSFYVDPSQMITIVLMSAIIGVLAGAWPAWRSTKVDVLKAVTVE